MDKHVVVETTLDVLKVLIGATQNSNNEIEHQDQIYEQEEDLVVLSNGNNDCEVLSFNFIFIFKDCHVPLPETGLKEVDEDSFKFLEVLKLSKG